MVTRLRYLGYLMVFGMFLNVLQGATIIFVILSYAEHGPFFSDTYLLTCVTMGLLALVMLSLFALAWKLKSERVSIYLGEDVLSLQFKNPDPLI